MKKRYTVELTPKQAMLILMALEHDSIDDVLCYRGEYSYYRCYNDLAKKLVKQGYRCEAFEGEFKKERRKNETTK